MSGTLALETWSEGRDSGTVGNVVLIPADMLYQSQLCEDSFQLPNVNYYFTLVVGSSPKVHIPCK